MKDSEIWKPIYGYEGLYEVSNLGRVKSLPRLRSYRGSKRLIKGGILRCGLCGDKKKYRCLLLCKDGIKERVKVHHIVLETFIGSRPIGCVARHLNDNSDDNRLENLSWGTIADNSVDKFRNGYRHHNIVLSDKKIQEILDENGSQRKIAAKFSVSQKMVMNIKRKRGYYGKF